MKHAIEHTFIKSYYYYIFSIETIYWNKKLSYKHIDIILKLRSGNLYIMEIEKKSKLEDRSL